MVLPGEPEYQASFALSAPGLPQHGQQPAGQLKLPASSNRLGLDKDQPLALVALELPVDSYRAAVEIDVRPPQPEQFPPPPPRCYCEGNGHCPVPAPATTHDSGDR